MFYLMETVDRKNDNVFIIPGKRIISYNKEVSNWRIRSANADTYIETLSIASCNTEKGEKCELHY